MENIREQLLKKIGVNKLEHHLTDKDWYSISEQSGLSLEFIREFGNKLYWGKISKYQVLTENFIREFQNNVDWTFIVKFQNISIELILEFKDYVNWGYLSRFFLLSEELLFNLKNFIDWDIYFYYQEVSFTVFKQYFLKSKYKNIDQVISKHLNQTQRDEIQRLLDFKYLFSH